MARGLTSGLIWGGLIAIGGAVFVSMTNPLPPAPDVTSAEPEISEPAAPPTQAPVVESSTSDAPVAQALTGTEAPVPPEPDTLEALEDADTNTVDAPTVVEAAPLAETAEPQTEAPSVTAAVETPPTPTLDTDAPAAPVPSEAPVVSTEPAQPTPVEEEAEAAEPEPATPVEETESDTEVTETIDVEEAPEPKSTEETSPPRVAALPRVETETPDTPSEEVVAAAPTQPEPETAPAPSIGERVAPLTDRETPASSLPSVEPETTTEDVAETSAEPADIAIRPFEQFAAPFANPEDKPLMSIVLIDDEASIGAEALDSFPYPLTFAIDPFSDQAAQKMERYRAAGFEVMAMMDLPMQASAQDAETSLEVGLSTLTEVVGVLEGTESGIQGSRPLSDQVTAILRDKGYGLIIQNSGLNTVQKLAVRDGVPSAYVFRDFDGAGQTPTVMRRFLDQAAFKARQEGGVIMLGRVRPDTISALLLWGLQDRADSVALSPASAVLAGQLASQ